MADNKSDDWHRGYAAGRASVIGDGLVKIPTREALIAALDRHDAEAAERFLPHAHFGCCADAILALLAGAVE